MSSSRFLALAPPPRPVPLPLVCRTLLGTLGRMGSMFLGAGMLFVLAFGVRLGDELRFVLSSTAVRGTVVGAEATDTYVNDERVYRYDFRFRAHDGQDYAGQSYSVGRWFDTGDRVFIEYATEHPESSRIEGTWISPVPTSAMALMAAFPIFGAVLVVRSAIRGVRQVGLLMHGSLAKGRILVSQPVRLSPKDTPILKHEYEFLAADGLTYYGAARALDTGLIGDEPEEPILYDSVNPNRSMFIDSLPLGWKLEVDEYG
ncbi:MAG: DUF3592 domain-containing protein, partial [Anaerolineales bacterium]